MKKSSTVLVSLLTLSGMLLNACSSTDAADEGTNNDDTGVTQPMPVEGSTVEEMVVEKTVSSLYGDGSYNADGIYQSPAGEETMVVNLTIENDIVTAVSITEQATDDESLEYQERFAGGIEAVVVGMSLNELKVDNVAGSSLTPKGFNSAVEAIKAQAAL